MGKLAVYKYFSFIMLVAQMLISVSTIIALYGGSVSPIGNMARAMLVYVLPLLIAANGLMVIYWLVRRYWFHVFIPIITVAFCIPYIGTIYQFGSGEEDNVLKSGLKVASYNVAMFNRETSGFMSQDILAELQRQRVDVFCAQEYLDASGDKKNSDSYKEHFPYMVVGKEDMVIYSRYPITDSNTILFEDTNNSAMWADIRVNGRDIRVFNVHLQTTGINRTLHQAAKLGQENLDVANNRLMQAIFGNYTMGLMIRTGQANIVANEVRQSPKPVILCGDFNDVPYSYVYNTMLGNMVDGFKECGSGWMRTFRGQKAVRIDYIFHDKSLKGISYYRSNLTYSDHYPIYMKIAM